MTYAIKDRCTATMLRGAALLRRREVLRLAGSSLALALAWAAGLLRPGAARAQAQSSWALRRAEASDAAALARIFNAQLAASLFPFSDRIPVWTEEKAAGFLQVYTGTRVLSRSGTVVGFVGFIDFAAPDAVSVIGAGIDPEIKVLAIDVGAIPSTERLEAVKRLAVAAGRALQQMGYASCAATISAQTGFANLFADRRTTKRTLRRNGTAEALDVRYAVADTVQDLAAEGL